MERQPEQSMGQFEPRVGIIIIRTEGDLALYQQAAEFAGGTSIEILPSDESTVDLFVADRDPADYPYVDIAMRAREALKTGAIFARVTEDMYVRHLVPGDVWNYFHSLKNGK